MCETLNRDARRLPIPVTALGVALLAALVLSSCGGDDAAATGGDHNDADVQFATEMIPHHAQALDMVDMAEGRGASDDFEQLLGDIEAAQGPEIEQMAGGSRSGARRSPRPTRRCRWATATAMTWGTWVTRAMRVTCRG